MPGPLPTGDAIRRNPPTIPTTNLPASGRQAPVPDPPAKYELFEKATDWWGWAWRTPQACGWDDGALFMVARRAQLEDDLQVLEDVEFDVDFLIGEDPDEAGRHLQYLMSKLKAMAGGKLQILREMRELDDRLGLTPKGLAALRWKIVPDDAATPVATGPARGKAPAKRGSGRRLKAV